MPEKKPKKITRLLNRLVENLVLTLISSYLISQTTPTCVSPQVQFENKQIEFPIVNINNSKKS